MSKFRLRLNLCLDSDVNCSSLVMGKLWGRREFSRFFDPSRMGIPGSVLKRIERNKQVCADLYIDM